MSGDLMYAVIKVRVSDPPERRARDICEGIGFACALLMDEYGLSADDIQYLLDRASDEAYNQEERYRYGQEKSMTYNSPDAA